MHPYVVQLTTTEEMFLKNDIIPLNNDFFFHDPTFGVQFSKYNV